MKGERTDDGKNGNNVRTIKENKKKVIKLSREKVYGKLNLRGKM
jgi:hypothetical protein